MKQKILCDYCGGYEYEEESPAALPMGGGVEMLIRGSNPGHEVERKLCMQCFVKALDTVLGEPKKK